MSTGLATRGSVATLRSKSCPHQWPAIRTAKHDSSVKLHEPSPAASVEYATATAPLIDVGVVMGTMPYMAPEQVQGHEVDARADLFAFGAILYEMMTGARAFAADSQAGLIAALLDQQPPPITAIIPSAPRAIERVVQRCLEKDPDDRWQSAQDLAAELKWIDQSLRQPESGAAPLPSRCCVATMDSHGRRSRARGRGLSHAVSPGQVRSARHSCSDRGAGDSFARPFA
ncbi:MAG TPA: protein kinase [Vicinamibacterales bacterium]|nr:protein kinase [Vicinamibacterales bacterium]